MDSFNKFKFIKSLLDSDDNNSKKIIVNDLSTAEDYTKLIESIDELKDNELFGSFFGDFLDYAKNLSVRKRDELLKEENKNKQKNKQNKSFVRKEFDKSADIKDKSNTIDKPSSHISVQQGLQIHKLVTEYVDTMIRPYAIGKVNNNVINDAYAGLYEFACWLLNK